MKVAITYEKGFVFQHFGHTSLFKVFEVENNQVVSTSVISSDGKGHGALAGLLAQNNVDVLICGGIGAGAINALNQANIKVYGGVVGLVDNVIEDFLKNQLNYNPNVKCSHHEHDENHTCGDHGCGAD